MKNFVYMTMGILLGFSFACLILGFHMKSTEDKLEMKTEQAAYYELRSDSLLDVIEWHKDYEKILKNEIAVLETKTGYYQGLVNKQEKIDKKVFDKCEEIKKHNDKAIAYWSKKPLYIASSKWGDTSSWAVKTYITPNYIWDVDTTTFKIRINGKDVDWKHVLLLLNN